MKMIGNAVFLGCMVMASRVVLHATAHKENLANGSRLSCHAAEAARLGDLGMGRAMAHAPFDKAPISLGKNGNGPVVVYADKDGSRGRQLSAYAPPRQKVPLDPPSPTNSDKANQKGSWEKAGEQVGHWTGGVVGGAIGAGLGLIFGLVTAPAFGVVTMPVAGGLVGAYGGAALGRTVGGWMGRQLDPK